MNEKSMELLRLAKQFLSESKLNTVYAYVGGSVGGGDADAYSDLDLTVYTDDRITQEKSTFYYKDKIVQLDILRTNELPNKQHIIDSPWDYRFFTEIAIVQDTNNRLEEINKFAVDCLKSKNGKQKMIEQVTRIVRERQSFAFDCLARNNCYSAAHASMGAWSEAAFLYLYLTHDSLSTGILIPHIQHLKNHFNAFQKVAPLSFKEDISVALQILQQFRRYLRNQKYAIDVDLSEIQDELIARKAQRLAGKNESTNLLWQIYGEALWLYFETADGISFEQYFANLPQDLQQGLSKIGFIPIDHDKATAIFKLSDEFLMLVSEI